MTTAKIELLEPANHSKLLKNELKDSNGAVVPLRYVYDRANKAPAVVFVGEVGAGMYSLMRKADPGAKLLAGKIVETEKAYLFEIGAALTDKAMTVALLDAGIRKQVLRVKSVADALEALQPKDAEPNKAKATPHTRPELELLQPANYARLIKAELKKSADAPVPLRYVYGRANGEPSVILVGAVGANIFKLMKVEDPQAKLLLGEVSETEKAVLFDMGSALTDKAMSVILLDVGVRKPAVRVNNVADAIQKLKQPEAPNNDQVALTQKAVQAFQALKARLAVAQKWAAANHRARLKAVIEQYGKEVDNKQGKDALVSVVSLTKTLQVIESTDLTLPVALLERIEALQKRRDGLKNPSLSIKEVKQLNEKIATVSKALEAEQASDWVAHGKTLDEVQDALDNAYDLQREYKSAKSEFESIEAEIKSLRDSPQLRLSPAKEGLAKVDTELNNARKKLPTDIQTDDPYEPFAGGILAAKAVLHFMREALKPKTKPDLSTKEGRKQAYVYDDSSTWVMKPVKYENKTGSANLPANLINELSLGRLASNTTAGGSVLKTGFEGHAHINGGSGGMAFVYQLDPDQYFVTPIVVDVAYARGNGKNKNKYAWETGGDLDYFPPLAKY